MEFRQADRLSVCLALRQVPSAQQVAASTQKAGEDTADEIIYVHGRKTKQDLEDQLKANAKKEAEYRPDYSAKLAIVSYRIIAS